jgi:hypothetical protein
VKIRYQQTGGVLVDSTETATCVYVNRKWHTNICNQLLRNRGRLVQEKQGPPSEQYG